MTATTAPSVAALPTLDTRQPRKKLIDAAFRVAMIVSVGFGLAALATLLYVIFADGWGHFRPQLWERFTSVNPRLAGARAAIFGTIWIISITAFLTIPIGVGAAVYLEEFARKDRWYNSLIELNIQNLAAVPSIIYGILGLAFIARGPLDLGFTVLTGGIILSLLVLPIVIIATREAIRAVPPSIRDGALALGATPLQTVTRQTLPAAIPGVATGVILALSRAIGEAAPLIMIGAATYITFNPTGLDSRFTALPIQIFNWIEQSRDEFHLLAAAASILLLLMLGVMNSFAIWLRNRYQKKW